MTTRVINHKPRFVVPPAAPQQQSRLVSTDKRDRIVSIDSMRTIANLTVIIGHWFAHLGSYGSLPYLLSYILLGNLANITAPFFFIVSGYFIRESLKAGRRPASIFKKLARRIIPIYLFWIMIYNFLPLFGLRQWLNGNFVAIHHETVTAFAALINNPVRFLFEGNTPHLWFLPALVITNGLVLWMIHRRSTRLLLPISVLGYIVFLMKVPYQGLFGGSPLPYYVMQLLPSFAFVSLGYGLNSERFTPKAKLGIAFMIAGYLLKLAERAFLSTIFLNPFLFTYLLATPLMSAGAFIFAISKPGFGKGTLFANLGKYSLGIYAAHVFVVNKLFQYHIFSMSMAFSGLFFVHLLGILSIYVLTITLIYCASRFQFLKSFVF